MRWLIPKELAGMLGLTHAMTSRMTNPALSRFLKVVLSVLVVEKDMHTPPSFRIRNASS
jgi:hypothetical protein